VCVCVVSVCGVCVCVVCVCVDFCMQHAMHMSHIILPSVEFPLCFTFPIITRTPSISVGGSH